MCCRSTDDIFSASERLNGFQKAAIVTGIVAAVALLALAAIFATPFLPVAAAGAISAAVVFCGGVPLVPFVLGATVVGGTIATIILAKFGARREEIVKPDPFFNVNS